MDKILIISSEFPPGPGGIGKHAADLAYALVNHNYHIDVLTPLDYADGKAKHETKISLLPNINLVEFDRKGVLTHINRLFIVIRYLFKNNYNRIVLSGTFPILMIWIIRVIKYSYHQHIDVFIHGSEVMPVKWIKRKVIHQSLMKASQVWAVSKFTKDLLPNKLSDQLNISILPNGIHEADWNEFTTATQFKDWNGCPKLLTVGNISPRKGQHRLIKALPEILKVYPKAHYHIVGIDKDAPRLIQLAIDLGVTEHITIHGIFPERSDLASAYQTADIFIMLSENQKNGDVEGFGIAILEANLFNVPALGAIGCGIEDAICPGVNGELVDGNYPKQISEKIFEILRKKQEGLYQCKKWALKHDWNVIINTFLNKN